MRFGQGLAEKSSYISTLIAPKIGRHSVFLSCRAFVPVLNQYRSACFEAASHPESILWLNSSPDNRNGTFIDNDTLLMKDAPCVGHSVCIRHRCNRGTTVYDGRRCTTDDGVRTIWTFEPFSAGQITRRSALSDVVRRGTSAVGKLWWWWC